jgi:membrane fusion protein, multidrug efflux system
MNSIRLSRACLGMALAFAACKGSEAEPPSGRPGRDGVAPGNLEVVVDVVRAERGVIARSVTVSGVIEPIRNVAVNSQLSGAIVSLSAEEGTIVEAGQVLARLDDRELQAQLALAEATFQVAETALARANQLIEMEALTQAEYERERTAHAVAKAQLEQIRTRLGFATIRAPIRGIVTRKLVEAGDVIGTQTRLFVLADVSTYVVRVGVSELDVVELEVNDPVDVVLDAFPGQAYKGRIRRIFPAADPLTRLLPVEVALVGAATEVARPGFLARTTFALEARNNAVLIPVGAVVSGATSQAVYVVQDGTALQRNVSVGLTSRGRVEILSGVEEGDLVITAGNNQVRDGSRVRLANDPVPTDGSSREGTES